MKEIEIKKTNELVEYESSLKFMQSRVKGIQNNSQNELLWFLSHNHIYTQGTSSKNTEIINLNQIKIIRSNRGGKTTYHGPGQRIIYFLINLNKRNKDIRKFITKIETSIIKSLKELNINSNSDRKNIGIWYKSNKNIYKIGAIGIRVKKWIAYHGFSININNDLNQYKKIIPCGIENKGVTNLVKIKNQDYKKLNFILEKNLINSLKN